MLDVNIEKILPVTEVRDSLNKIVDEVEATDELYVITKNGKPAAIVVGIHHLEKLTGISHGQLMPDEKKDEDIPALATPAETPSAIPAPEISAADDLFSETPVTPPSVAPTPAAAAPDTLSTPDMPDLSAPVTSIDNTASAVPSPAASTFETPDSSALASSNDIFGPPTDTATAAPLNPPADPNLAPIPSTDSSGTNQSQGSIPPAPTAQV